MTGFRKRPLLLVLLGLVAAGMAGVAGWVSFVWGADLLELVDEGRAVALRFLEGVHPLAYFAAFALGPALGVPITLFYLTTSTVLGGGGLVWGILLAWLALATNIAFGYWLAASFMNPVIVKLLRYWGYEIPKASPENESTIIIICRLSPLPFPIQNWVLGVGHFRFLRYMLYSWPIQAGLGTGVILVGDALLRGGTGLAIFGFFLICLFMYLAHLGRQRFGSVPKPANSSEE